jgi:hypothetical protein
MPATVELSNLETGEAGAAKFGASVVGAAEKEGEAIAFGSWAVTG